MSEKQELYVVTEQNVFAELDVDDKSKRRVVNEDEDTQRLINEAIAHNASIVK